MFGPDMSALLLVAIFLGTIGVGMPIGMTMLVTSVLMLLFVVDLPLVLVPRI
jgi:hypothetical protein